VSAVLPYGDEAIAACSQVFALVSADDADRPTACTDFTVAQLVDHLQRSMVLLAGVAGTELAVDPAAAPRQSITALANGAVAAWRRRGVAGEVAVGRTLTPARLAAEIVLLELVVHAWDLTPVTGRALDASPQLCEHVLTQAQQLITEDKRGRAFAPPVVIAADESALNRLMGFTGRTP
jgi:uncharacterized protein (TIGR03086 family)